MATVVVVVVVVVAHFSAVVVGHDGDRGPRGWPARRKTHTYIYIHDYGCS